MLIYGQYDSGAYPLKRYSINEMPGFIIETVVGAAQLFDVMMSAGIAYVIQTKDSSDPLKDIDIVMLKRQQANAIDYLCKRCDLLYVNVNRRGQQMATCFWISGTSYYKLDVLFAEDFSDYDAIFSEPFGMYLKVKSPKALWLDTNIKIIERELRQHSSEKTEKHCKRAIVLVDKMARLSQIGLSEDEIINLSRQATEKLAGLVPQEVLNEYTCSAKLLSEKAAKG